MLTKISLFFDRLMQRFIPDPFVITLLLTLVVFVLSVFLTPTTPTQAVLYWGDGFWNLLVFTMQMVLILFGGYILGTSPPIKKILDIFTTKIKTPSQAIVSVTLVSSLASWLNWGLGLVIGALLCRRIYRVLPQVNYRVLVASAYSGFLLWHGGLSGSIPLLIASEGKGNFTRDLIGNTISLSQTVFSPLNLSILIILFISLPILNWMMLRGRPVSQNTKSSKSFIEEDLSKSTHFETPHSTASRLEASIWIPLSIVLVAMFYFVLKVKSDSFSLGLNQLNFILIFLGLVLHLPSGSRSFLASVQEASKKVGPIVLLYPFYSAIMGVMVSSGLAKVISDGFVWISNSTTLPVFTFFSAGVINLFVPSGGGQWVVQGPIVIPAAQSLGVEIPKIAMAVAWGDAWTNMAQPFFALPLLAIAGLSVKDIMGFCVTILFYSGIVISLAFLLSSL